MYQAERENLWRQVQLALEGDIATGRLEFGERLPSEQDLACRFAVHRNTVRRAIARLEEKGVVRAEQGRGTFVQEPTLSHKYSGGATITPSKSQYALARRRVLRTKEIDASRPVASSLRLKTGSSVIWVETLRTIEDTPLALTEHYFPLPRFVGIAEILAQTGSIPAAYEHFGITFYKHAEAWASAEQARKRDSLLLKQVPAKPVLCVSNLWLDNIGNPIALTNSRFASGRFSIEIDHLS